MRWKLMKMNGRLSILEKKIGLDEEELIVVIRHFSTEGQEKAGCFETLEKQIAEPRAQGKRLIIVHVREEYPPCMESGECR
jgi:hypothetical protein